MPLKKRAEYNYNLSLLTDVEKAYLAGFIDGEGCIGIRNGGPNCRNGRIKLHITNTNETILRYFKDLVGFGSFYQAVSEGRYGNHKAAFVYEVCANQCVCVLKEILPFLKIKKEQALLALEFADTKNWGDNNINSATAGIRKIIGEKIAKLNKRGVK
jgi:hypothetical protein